MASVDKKKPIAAQARTVEITNEKEKKQSTNFLRAGSLLIKHRQLQMGIRIGNMPC